MRPYVWLVAISSFTATSSAWPALPHFELQQAASTNEAQTERSMKSTCKRITQLSNLSDVAGNQTLRDTLIADQKLTPEQVDYIETKKDAIESELATLTSNTTLSTECNSINAHRKAVKDCKKLDKLEKLVEMANNKTAYDEHLAGELLNKMQMEQLKKNMEDAEIKLQALHGNSTLVELCANESGLRQNGAIGQAAGGIGEAAVDNSGAISLSTSGATALRTRLRAVSYALGMAWLGTMIFL
ncbi:hypothetical protein SVAN01_08313 [Stagonosporopsis vannaccii]|nr:hypothetical protein SVAN01_08313 [Stagonosporopsis vannaccii]